MSFPGQYGEAGRDLQARTRRILQNHLEHDLTAADRAALEKVNGRLTAYALGGAFVGPLAGILAVNYFLKRSQPQALTPGVRPRLPPGRFLLGMRVGLFALRIQAQDALRGAGLLSGFLVTDLVFAFAFRQARGILEREGDISRIETALQNASVEALRAQADALEHSESSGRTV